MISPKALICFFVEIFLLIVLCSIVVRNKQNIWNYQIDKADLGFFFILFILVFAIVWGLIATIDVVEVYAYGELANYTEFNLPCGVENRAILRVLRNLDYAFCIFISLNITTIIMILFIY